MLWLSLARQKSKDSSVILSKSVCSIMLPLREQFCAEAVSENSKTAGHFVGEVGSGWWNRKVTIDFIISITNWKLEQKFRLHSPILICSTLQKVLKKLKTSGPSYPSGRLLISPKFILLHDNKLKPPGRVMKNCLQDLWLLLFFKGTRWWQQIL